MQQGAVAQMKTDAGIAAPYSYQTTPGTTSAPTAGGAQPQAVYAGQQQAQHGAVGGSAPQYVTAAGGAAQGYAQHATAVPGGGTYATPQYGVLLQPIGH